VTGPLSRTPDSVKHFFAIYLPCPNLMLFVSMLCCNFDFDAGDENPWNMGNLLGQLRTASELMRDSRALSEVRNAMLKSQRIVFMGFGYHPQNLDILIDSVFAHNPEVLAGIHGLPGPSQTTVVRMLRRKLGLDKDDRLMVVNGKCYDIFRDYGMMLES